MKNIPAPLRARGQELVSGEGAQVEIVATTHGLNYPQRAARAAEIAVAVNSHERALHLLDLCRKLPNIPLEVRHDIESFIQKMHPVQEMPPL